MRFGTEQAGFSIAYRADPRCVSVCAWGEWDRGMAVHFAQVVMDECRPAVRPFNLLLDVTRLRPPDANGQLSFRTIMVSLKRMGLGAALVVIGDNAIIKMQLMRIAKQNWIENWTYFPSVPTAL